MKPKYAAMSILVIASFSNLPVRAQDDVRGEADAAHPEARSSTIATSGQSPIQVLTVAEYNQRVQAGQKFLPITPAILAQQAQQQQAADAGNQAIVDAFIKQNPNLPNVAALAAAPANPTLAADGNYLYQVADTSGGSQTVELLGQGSVLAGLASSIQEASDPAYQLALYQLIYNQYGAQYNKICAATSKVLSGCGNVAAPGALTSVAALQNASLSVIENALQSLVSQGLNLTKLAPTVPVVDIIGQFASCSADIGSSLKATQVHYGDQTSNRTCSGVPGSQGLLANFNWPGKDQLTCVKSQGSRGTCHIFASTSVFEELIARDTGNHVNLSEQEFNEQVKFWTNNYFKGDGRVLQDVNDAKTFSYGFGYEDQWDYNPVGFSSTSNTTCANYPYPNPISGLLEPGCSNSAPESPEYCVGPNCQQQCEALVKSGKLKSATTKCTFTLADLSGARSPYMSDGGYAIWNPSNPSLSVSIMILELAMNNGLALGFKPTSVFGEATRNAAKEKADGLPSGYVKSDLSGCDVESSSCSGGHAVHVVAYIDNTQLQSNAVTKDLPLDFKNDGGGYFVIKNSWGDCVGDAGYFYLPASYLAARATDVTLVSSLGELPTL